MLCGAPSRGGLGTPALVLYLQRGEVLPKRRGIGGSHAHLRPDGALRLCGRERQQRLRADMGVIFIASPPPFILYGVSRMKYTRGGAWK